MSEASQAFMEERAQAKTFPAKAYAAPSPTSPLAPYTIQRRSPRPQDVEIEILYCGICHSDLHQSRDEWHAHAATKYPCVPGHEIVGRVVKVGPAVGRFKEDDIVAVGCMVDSCRTCPNCLAGEEQYCETLLTLTYNSKDKVLGGVTYGGYSQSIVVDEAFVMNVRHRGNLAGVAPLVCAGITTYSPMRHWSVSKGQKVGIIGLGGLGHMGVKFAKAFGAHVTVFTTSPQKKTDALKLGADEIAISKDPSEMDKRKNSFDFILDTVSGEHDVNTYLALLKLNGTMVLVGAPEKPLAVASFNLSLKRRRLAGSIIGGIRETQAMLDFCAQHDIRADVETIQIQQVNEAYERLLRSDVKYRFVIDIASLS